MELVDGRTLKQLVQERGPLDPTTAVNLTEQVLRALGYAHRRGIVHRDIKPQNVIVDGEGVAKVADFGIARAANSEMTETGAIVGTVQYLSPEQAQGQPVDRRSDLYSVGVVLYELLTGQVPFDGEAPVSIALKHVSERPVPPGQLRPGVPPALEAVVMRALEKDPARRFQSAEEFIAALEAGRRAPTRPVVAEPGSKRTSRARAGGCGCSCCSSWPLAAVGAYFLLTGGRVDVPRVVGREAGEAADILHDQGLEVAFVPEVSDDVPRDEVISQDPEAGERAREGTTVTLAISSGKGEAPVPAVEGQSREDAEQAITDAGFKVKIQEAFSDDVPEGDVISTSPKGGEPLQKGRTVTLRVSKGVEGPRGAQGRRPSARRGRGSARAGGAEGRGDRGGEHPAAGHGHEAGPADRDAGGEGLQRQARRGQGPPGGAGRDDRQSDASRRPRPRSRRPDSRCRRATAPAIRRSPGGSSTSRRRRARAARPAPRSRSASSRPRPAGHRPRRPRHEGRGPRRRALVRARGLAELRGIGAGGRRGGRARGASR